MRPMPPTGTTAAATLLLTAVPAWLATAATIHVPADQPTIQAGIIAATAGDTVLVAPGTYFENIDFLGKAVTVTSNAGAGSTAIDGAPGHAVVTFANGEGAGSILSGFTITGATVAGKGGGVACLVTSPVIADNIIAENVAGGGAGIYSVAGAPVIRRNTITLNSATGDISGGGGVYCESGSAALIEDNDIVGNTSTGFLSPGGGVFCNQAPVVIRMNRIRDNMTLDNGGGIACFYESHAVIEANTILGNSALSEGGGIVIAGQSQVDVTGNVVADNHGSRGGGIAIFHLTTTVVSGNTLSGNSTTLVDGGAILCFVGAPTIERNIIAYSEHTWAIACRNGGYPTVACNDLYGNELGNQFCGSDAGGNFSEDPLFCDVQFEDYSLEGGSPCLPGQHPAGADCGLIGALEQGCGPTPIDSTTWGAIKRLHR